MTDDYGDHWPDCDMLPLGHLGIRSVDGGGDRFTRFTLTSRLLTNEAVLHLHRYGKGGTQVLRSDKQAIWTVEDEQGNYYAALFNLRHESLNVHVTFQQLNLPVPRALFVIYGEAVCLKLNGMLFLKIFRRMAAYC